MWPNVGRLTSFTPEERQKIEELRLLRSENIGPRHFYQLLKRFGTAREATLHLPDIARRFKRLTPLRIPSLAEIEAEYLSYKRAHITLIAHHEPLYPPLLRTCEDAPPFLSVQGRLELLQKPFLAIVGARHGSLAGQKITKMFARELGQAGFVIVSGLARGIDTAAHLASLETGTAAVLAGGLDQIYPPENKELSQQIVTHGLLISEMPLGCPPSAILFPRRNRLISGLARGTLVVEAALKSGSLITARYAAEQGRDVFAIPGNPLDPRARGTNQLLKDGAYLVQDPDDILSFYPTPSPVIPPTPPSLSSFFEPEGAFSEETIRSHLLDTLTTTPLTVNEIAENLGCPLALVRAALVEIEIAGYLDRHSGDRVSLSPPATPAGLSQAAGPSFQ